MKTLQQTGDTIVEVMVVLAILGLATSISFATANRSLQSARQAQESSMATELLQTQVESLLSLRTGGTIFTVAQPNPPNSSYFCIDTSGATPVVSAPFGSNAVPGGSFPSACVIGNYYLSIQYSGPPNDNFTVEAQWSDVAGQGIDSATVVYGVHQQ